MAKDPNLTRRNRLAGFDYANPGYYLITACSMDRRHIFGRIQVGEATLSAIGHIVDLTLHSTLELISSATLDAYVIMPNHIHILVYFGLENEGTTISSMMKHLKGASAASIRKEGLLPPTMRSVWQKGFHDQIIRNDLHLAQVRSYVADNPRKWSEDEYFED